MKIKEFKQQTDVIAKNQPQYEPLPCHIDREDDWRPVTSCWSLSFKERIKLLFVGRVYFQLCTFGGKVQPQKASTCIDDLIRKNKCQ